MNKKIGITGIWVLFLVFISWLLLREPKECIYEIEHLYWWELIITLSLGISVPYIFSLWHKLHRIIKIAFYLTMVAQSKFIIDHYFWIAQFEHSFFLSPIGQGIHMIWRGSTFAVFLYFLREVCQSALKWVYKNRLPVVKQTKTTRDDQLLEYFYSILKFFITPVFIFTWIAYVFGASATMAIYTAGGFSTVFLAAVAFAFRSIFNDYLAGIWIHIEDQIRVGDWITINGIKGMIIKINPRYTKLVKLSGSEEVIPNGMMVEHNFTNHIKDKYHGIQGSFSLSNISANDVPAILKSLEAFIIKELDTISYDKNRFSSSSTEKKDQFLSITFDTIEGDMLKFSYSFKIKVDSYNQERETKTEKFLRDEKLEKETKLKINLEILKIIEKLNFKKLN